MTFVYLAIVLIALAVIGCSMASKPRGTVHYSNLGIGSWAWLFIAMLWVSALAVALVVMPTRKTYVVPAVLIWGVAMGLFWLAYLARVKKVQFQPASIGYVPVFVKAWFVHAVVPLPVKTGSTAIVSLRLVEQVMDMGMSIDTGKDIERQVQQNQVFRLQKWDEEAMVESGLLRTDRSITVRVAAPAFREVPETKTTIDDLVRAPLRIPLVPVEEGEHSVILDFFDASSNRCGGFVLPVSVREKDPVFGKKALQRVQIVAAIFGMAAFVKLIVDIIMSLL